jgi:hypothetical protein
LLISQRYAGSIPVQFDNGDDTETVQQIHIVDGGLLISCATVSGITLLIANQQFHSGMRRH